MDNLIKEEILRINELMNTKILNESEYKECSRFSESPQKLLVCRKIASLKSWLHKDDGLGMKNVINNIKSFFKDIWLGIDIANKNYLHGKSQWGKF